jgi:8-hydroxy-5-deazaflavin:NADPH oxidoreductase
MAPIYCARMPSPAADQTPPSAEGVCIIGASGPFGFGLALRFAHAGVPVTIGSRVAERAQATASRAEELVRHGSFSGFVNAEAAAKAELVILAVPFLSQAETLASLHEALRPGQVLLDTTVPLATAVGGRATRTLGVWQGSAAQQAQEMVPEGVRVVSALHTVSASALRDLDQELGEDVLLCGAERADKRRAAALIEQIEGLRCVDCGRLEMARITESITALLISVNRRHKTHAGIRFTRVPDERWD